MRYQFETYELDTIANRLDCQGEPTEIKGLSLSFLTALVKAAPEALTADQLAQTVWGRPHITEDTLKKRASLLRSGMGMDVIKRLPDKTFAMAVPVQVSEPSDPVTHMADVQTEIAQPVESEIKPLPTKGSGRRVAWRWLIVGGVVCALVLIGWGLASLTQQPARLVDPNTGTVLQAPG